MKEKSEELLLALGLDKSEKNLQVVLEWTKRHSKLVTHVFGMDPLLLGSDKKKELAFKYTKACLEIGRLAVNSCGEMLKEKASLKNKFDVYQPQILVWDLSMKNNGLLAPGEKQ